MPVLIYVCCSEVDRDYVFDENAPQTTYPPCTSAGDPTCVFEQCMDLEILDDDDLEGEQRFEVVITSVSLRSIVASPSSTVIIIQDNTGTSFYVAVAHAMIKIIVDGQLVFSGPTMVLESSGSHDICVNVESPGQIELTQFEIFIEAVDGSAGMYIIGS